MEKIITFFDPFFISGNNQAVRLPKSYRINTDTLLIQKISNTA
nr:hypothetical protein [uncultured Moraxella sp.]